MPPKFNFFLQWANLISPWLKIKKKLLRLPKIEGSILKYRVGPPLWPTYISERRTKFANAYWIKVRCYREHNENLRHMLGTYWKHQKSKKNNLPFLPILPQKTKTWVLGVNVGSPHWVPRNLVLILVRLCWNFNGSFWLVFKIRWTSGVVLSRVLQILGIIFGYGVFQKKSNSNLVVKLENGLMRSPWLWP